MDFKQWLEIFDITETTSLQEWLSENLCEVTTATRYSVEVNFRSTPKEVLNAFAKICLGYVSAALKQRNFHVKHVFEQVPHRIIVSSRNWDDGEWTGMIYFLPNHDSGTFMIAKGFYDRRLKTVKVRSRQKCKGDSAAEMAKELINVMNDLQGKEDRHLEKLKAVPSKRGPKR